MIPQNWDRSWTGWSPEKELVFQANVVSTLQGITLSLSFPYSANTLRDYVIYQDSPEKEKGGKKTKRKEKKKKLYTLVKSD